ncbi:4-amino-4-deoxy-L-arabinose transferase [Desulfonatronum thiosulfatophilum]|uniref:4-amino-4-deoxy-L-arabinose transferase n=1 Tax=Desulfonatronum thiosulfatophilum TaxID=617002 RepID=A0A1G6ESK2_9BACT|nr:glycosyltransferase family 39 protein [Desulfonatronum thiosulfatophilum]SDB60410.1 4-amino-4-deoxy-L-arabinose transferase [Desulfonatronum thiosulfatophilum]
MNTQHLDGPLGYLALILFCLVLFLPGMTTLPPFDRDEARFAQASRQMLEEGDFIRIKFQEQDRHKKPVGIYWLQAASARIINPDALWPYRLPSVMGAVLAVLLTFSLARRAMEAKYAFLAAAMLAGSVLLVTEAHLAKTDAMLLASIAAIQVALAMCYIRKPETPAEPWLWLLFWGGMGGTILLKGPVGPMIAGVTLLTLFIADRHDPRRFSWLRGLRPGPGLLLTAAMVLPWLIAVSMATDGSFVSDAVKGDLLPKLISGHESHGAPPGMYLLLFTLTFWPASLLAWPALVRTWKMRSADPSNRLIRFLWAWIVPSWIIFELVPTKLPHYVLPLYPAIALLTALWLSGLAAQAEPGKYGRWIEKIGSGLWLAIGMILGLGLIVAPLYLDRSVSWWGLLAALVALAMTYAGWRLYLEQKMLQVCSVLLLGAILIFPVLLGKGLPEMRAFWVSRTLQHTVDSLRQEHPDLQGVIASTGFQEPSLVFLLGTNIRLISPAQAAHHLAEHPHGMALVESRREAQFHETLAELGLAAEPLANVRGFNYSKGQWVAIDIFANANR